MACWHFPYCDFAATFSDADCGRGFARIENACVNISYESVLATATPSIPDRCQAMQATQLDSITPAFQYMLKVRVKMYSH